MKRIGLESTIDTSCVIALDAIDLIPLLSFLFSRVWLPKAVRAELFRRRRTKDRLRALLDAYDFLQNCDEYDHGAVDVLLLEWTGQGKKDRGEAEAIVQAAVLGATVVIDKRRGRRLAANFQLKCHGTIWILRRFYDAIADGCGLEGMSGPATALETQVSPTGSKCAADRSGRRTARKL